MACGDSRRAYGDPALVSWDSLGRLDAESEVDDCRRFTGGDRGGSASGSTTAEAIGLRKQLAKIQKGNISSPTQCSQPS